MFWAWSIFDRSLSKVIQQSSFQSLATSLVSATELWSEEQSLEKRNLQTEDEKKAPKNAENKKWVNGKKKRRKMKNEMNETLISYLTRRSISSSFFHFVISALALMSSLNELMLRTSFIAMYKNLDVLSMIDLRSSVEQSDSAEQLSESSYSFTILKTRRETTSSSERRKESSSIALMMSRCMKNVLLVELDVQQKRFELSSF